MVALNPFVFSSYSSHKSHNFYKITYKAYGEIKGDSLEKERAGAGMARVRRSNQIVKSNMSIRCGKF